MEEWKVSFSLCWSFCRRIGISLKSSSVIASEAKQSHRLLGIYNHEGIAEPAPSAREESTFLQEGLLAMTLKSPKI